MMKKVADLPIQIDNTSFLLLQKLKRNLEMNEEKSLRQTLVQARVFEEIVRVRNREKVACVCIRVCVCLCVCIDVLFESGAKVPWVGYSRFLYVRTFIFANAGNLALCAIIDDVEFNRGIGTRLCVHSGMCCRRLLVEHCVGKNLTISTNI